MITQYIVPKDQLHQLLRAVGVLQPTDEILLVNNTQLQDSNEQFVTVMVEDSSSKKTIDKQLPELTAKELGTALERLAVMAQFIHAEYETLRTKFMATKDEFESRQANPGVTEDGIPKHIEQTIDTLLKDLLK
ncbi:hypothetical protein MASR2M18_05840 [Ignavibacteria bacterium]|nr:hypothetical protein [Bacteroidota bacterium]